MITPAKGIGKGASFEVVVRYNGVTTPRGIWHPVGVPGDKRRVRYLGPAARRSVLVPEANDHPTDKASFTFEVTVPEGLQVVANGRLVDTRRHGPDTTWTWDAQPVEATYLATVDAGRFYVHTYKRNEISFLDAIDPDLYTPFAVPHPGTRFAYSQQADSSYKRLMRTIHVPGGGGKLTFSVTRDTEPEYDFFVEEPTTRAPTTGPRSPSRGGGITADDLGNSCYGWEGNCTRSSPTTRRSCHRPIPMIRTRRRRARRPGRPASGTRRPARTTEPSCGRSTSAGGTRGCGRRGLAVVRQ